VRALQRAGAERQALDELRADCGGRIMPGKEIFTVIVEFRVRGKQAVELISTSATDLRSAIDVHGDLISWSITTKTEPKREAEEG